MIILKFSDIAREAGYILTNGKFDFPVTRSAANRLAYASVVMVRKCEPENKLKEVTLIGPGPEEYLLAIVCAIQGYVSALTYIGNSGVEIPL